VVLLGHKVCLMEVEIKRRDASSSFLVVFILVIAGCSERSFDPAAEEAKLLRRDAEWADLASAGKDVEKIASYWGDDAVLIFPGQPMLEGKAAIRAYVTESLNTPGFKSIGCQKNLCSRRTGSWPTCAARTN
jgi:hypothetical protein